MADHRSDYEAPCVCVLDARDIDRLLVRLRTVHGESGRADIAPELQRATRAQQAARERVAFGSP
jgi:hypothetical protein